MAKRWYNFFVVTDPAQDQSSISGEQAPTTAEDSATAPVEFQEDVPAAAPPAAIYAAARIPTPSHGYTILKVAEMLNSEHLGELPADVRRKSVLVALDAAGVPLKDVVADAVQRDRALDTYEKLLEKNLEALQTSTAEENRRLEAEVDQRVRELRAQVEQNTQALTQAREQLAVWRIGKRTEEARIADAVAYFVSENPITR